MPHEIDEAWIDEAIDRYRRLDTLRAEFDKAVAAHVVTIHSPDGTVEVLVTAAGEVTDVRIHGNLRQRDAPDLAREMRAAVTQATQAARWAREKIHDEIFGAFRALGE
ncbi:YbaB/EbfC family nucleoid-associated protein [Actinoplanes sp. NPDC051859]|uniref:YbaB/EbfC family nucleoid-associated protein n=1 Tax=Actinoplanes sp. NPDC051859 TaxID=3363909 RepID=UPI0037BD6A89